MCETLEQEKVLDGIGAGGMGEVYRARDTRHGRTVAIKVLTAGIAGDQERRDRFLLEARAAAALSHPNISALYEIGEDQDELFLVFEFVPGETLKTAIAGRFAFRGTTSTAVGLQIVQAAAPVPSSVNPSVPREIDAIVAKALSKSLDLRYESAATMAAELRSVVAILDVRSDMSEPAVST